ncbi:MAG: hypothetical protein M1592_04320 [Candidatus Thermoplasmatota archaeon]|nr:hypothetical protein [Candidatus Thermoplasmatota archaeon]
MAVLLPLLGSHVKHTVPDVFDVYLYELTNPHSGVGKELDYQPVTVPYLPVLVYITELKYLLNLIRRGHKGIRGWLLFQPWHSQALPKERKPVL